MYYGDEIGMGDNIYLGDRNGVRTPMQWNSDRNAGFSKCDPARLYFPVVMDPIYGYQVVNVEAQLSDQSSLLHWTRNMIALRKLFQVFGRGTLRFLHPENRKILAYLRNMERDDGSHETVLCVANLSRFAQPVSLDLSEFAGAQPVEMLGYVSFPLVGTEPYPLTVAPYSFLWFELQPESDASVPTSSEVVGRERETEYAEVAAAILSSGWGALANGAGLALLQARLPAWLIRQRWFGAKTRLIQDVRVAEYTVLSKAGAELLSTTAHPTSKVSGSEAGEFGNFFIEVLYSEGEPDIYQIPLALTVGPGVESITTGSPNSIIARLETEFGAALLHDATIVEDFRQALLNLIEEQTASSAGVGKSDIELTGYASSAFASVRGTEPLPAKVSSAEQSNTNVVYDSRMIMKVFRRIQPGENPDVEIGRFLTEVAHFPRIAAFLGEITTGAGSNKTTTAMLQELVTNEGDGWYWTLDELSRFYESVSTCPLPEDEGVRPTLLTAGVIPHEAREHAGLYLGAAALLGRRTAEMHLALSTETEDEAFRAEPFTAEDIQLDAQRIDRQIHTTLDALKAGMSGLRELTADAAASILSRRIVLFERAHSITNSPAAGKRIRIHGDYHLGQTLRSKNDFVILDFEGEPARSLAERRRKQCPLKDVAGMLRSFSYAVYSGLDQLVQRRPDSLRALEPWARLWENASCTAFLEAYQQTIAADTELLPEPKQAQALLDAYLLEKALYELLYELNNRPAWIRIPLAGLLGLTL